MTMRMGMRGFAYNLATTSGTRHITKAIGRANQNAGVLNRFSVEEVVRVKANNNNNNNK